MPYKYLNAGASDYKLLRGFKDDFKRWTGAPSSMTKDGDARNIPKKIRDAWWFMPTAEELGSVMGHYIDDVNA